MSVNHLQNAMDAYARYRERQDAIDEFERQVIAAKNNNKLLARLELEKQQFYNIAVASRNAYQEQVRTEALMHIAKTLDST
jgi:hypothetical protein